MLPHRQGEDASIASAFEFCKRAFHNFDETSIEDEDARGWVEAIKAFMDTTGVDDPSGRGRWLVRAEQLTADQRAELSRALDALGTWFDAEFWGV